MPNELTPAEVAEILEKLIPDVENDMTIYSHESAALRYAATLCRKVADGEYKPVVHGAWKIARESERCYLVKCTNCGHSVAIAANVPVYEWREAHKYCVDCGALMDGKDGAK